MKWKEFKDCIESQGVNNDTKISYIDWFDNFWIDEAYINKPRVFSYVNNEAHIE